MAENTYKKAKEPTEKKNKRKGADEEVKKKPSKPLFDTKLLKDRRFKIVIGFFLIILSISMFFSFISYLFTGSNDQSVVEAYMEGSLIAAGRDTQNWLGLFGALVAHLFIYKWFGIASFLVLPLI